MAHLHAQKCIHVAPRINKWENGFVTHDTTLETFQFHDEILPSHDDDYKGKTVQAGEDLMKAIQDATKEDYANTMAILPPRAFPWKYSIDDEINSLVPLPVLEDGDVHGMVNWLAETPRELVERGCKIVKLHWEKGNSSEFDWEIS